MTEKYIDLHLHTTASDGSFTPKELVLKAKELGFSAIAITDHDTVDGIEVAQSFAQELDLEVIPGIEMNTDYQNTEIHILGYYIDHQDPKFLDMLASLQEARYNRVKKILAKLDHLGLKIDLDEIIKLAEGGALGRPHIAQIMLENGYVQNWSQAFDDYIGRHAPAYVERKKLTPKDAIRLIKDAKGVPVVAHPLLMEDDKLLTDLLDWGIEGVEVYHTEHTEDDSKRYLKFAQENNLLITAGSDCHGPKRKGEMLLGKIKAPYRIVKSLREKKQEKSVKKNNS